MTTQTVHNLDKAQRVLEANLTPRYRELDNLQAYVEGRQYAGKAHWLTEDDVPLLDRAPCVVEPIAENAIESFVDLVFGEGHFPGISSAPDEDDEVFDERFGLNEADSELVDRFIQHIAKQCDLQEVSREALARAMGERSAVGIVCVRDGKLAVDLEHAKCCVPTFDKQRPKLIRSLEIRYPYLERYFDGHEKRWAMRCMLYRRVINEQTDTTFAPIVAHETGEDPGIGEWRPETTITHGFGFCPVVWWAYRKRASEQTGPDGIAIHERVLDEIDALNRTLSQRHRAGLICGDPQIVETGVDEDVNPAPAGRAPEPMRAYPSESPGTRADNARWQSGGQAGKTGARRKGPNVIWRYPNENSKVEYLLLPPEALKVLDDGIGQLHQMLAEAMSWVRADPTTIAGESKRGVSLSSISGKALAWMYRRQTMQCDSVRPDAWDNWLVPLINLLLRVSLAYASEPARGALYLPGLKKTAPILKRFVQPMQTGTDEAGNAVTTDTWFSPSLSPNWPPYFPPTEEDQARVAKQAADDHEAGFITKRTAVEKISDFYDDIENVDQYLEALEKESQENMAKAHKMGLGAEETDDDTDGDQGGDTEQPGDGAGKNAPPKRGSNGRSDASAGAAA